MDGSVTKAQLLIEGETNPFTVQFNPTEYELSNSIQYSEKTIPGLNGPIGQYIAGNSRTLNVSFYFDTYQPPTLEQSVESGTDVADVIGKIVQLTQINGKIHRVPKVTFSWGSIKFEGIVVDVKEHYTMFLSSGMPVRAKVDVTFKSVYDVEKDGKSTPLESPDRTKAITLKQGESLWSIASREYDDPEQWKVIALENGILNPLDIYPGQMLKLPPL